VTAGRRLRVEARTCKAGLETTHLASRRRVSPYCEQHFPEYQAHRKRYNDMNYNFTHGRTSFSPPDPEEYWASVLWSPIRPLYTQLDLTQVQNMEVAFKLANNLFRLLRRDRLLPARDQRQRWVDTENALAQLELTLRDANIISIPEPDPRENPRSTRYPYEVLPNNPYSLVRRQTFHE
jgi:hypothetical protein